MAEPEEKTLPAAVHEIKADASADASPIPARPTHSIITTKSGQKRKIPTTSSAAANKKAATDAPFVLFDILPESSPLVNTFRECLLSHFFPRGNPPSSASSSLPGPQPESLTRGDLSRLVDGNYWVCEKSDGERAILLIHQQTKIVVLVDRKWTCRIMKAEMGELLVEWFASIGDTVIDAELLEVEAGEEDGGEKGEGRDRRGTLYRISMFDVISINGLRVADRMFGGVWSSTNPPVSDGSGRMDVLRNQIQKPYKEKVEAGRKQYNEVRAASPSSPPPLPPLLLLDNHLDFFIKNFVAKHKVEDILKNITHHSSTNPHFLSHIYRTSRSSNHNDGLIFTPDCDSYYCRQTPLLKWKWPDLNTIDFLIQKPFRGDEKGLPLLSSGYVRGNDGKQRVAEVVFDYIRQPDRVSVGYLAEIEGRGVDSAIIECGYSKLDSDWHIKGVRWDKAKSNFLTTVVATIKAVMDDLQSVDIIAACKKNRFQYRREEDKKPME